MPRVSVIMPVRNARAWLAEALESVRSQTEKGWELLAVDDGSDDGSGDILSDYARRDPRVKIVETPTPGGGIVAALNAALGRVSAPLTARMDADDVCHSRRLERQCDALESDASLFAVTCRVRPFPSDRLRDGMTRYFDWQHSLSSPAELARDRFVESPMLHPSVVMRTAALTGSLGGWRDAGWPEDWDLFSRAFEAGLGFLRLPEVLYDWRLHPGQSTRADPRYSEESFRAARAHFLARSLRGRGIGGPSENGVAHGTHATRPLGSHATRSLWMMGAGPVGKKLAKALAAEGIEPTGFVDVDPKKIGGRIEYEGRRWPVVDAAFLERCNPRPFVIAAVGAVGGRGQIRQQLSAWGWTELDDFYVAA